MTVAGKSEEKSLNSSNSSKNDIEEQEEARIRVTITLDRYKTIIRPLYNLPDTILFTTYKSCLVSDNNINSLWFYFNSLLPVSLSPFDTLLFSLPL
jgi:hypothetical protein